MLITKKAFIVSDKFLVSNGTVKKVTDILSQIDIDFVVYDEVKQNPTVTNVNKGLK
ncbi:iron-containing alcohol dehydrogenase, partial [Clostridioides difficile]|uniref:iron-containing alcohol dehydrogenase n=1 Tax=Clostridioides difficile TaxID=1496 RepID=UPI001F28F385